MTSVVFKDIYEKMKGKQFGNITFNGKNLPHIMEQSTQSINSGKGVKIDQMYYPDNLDLMEFKEISTIILWTNAKEFI